jgi:hypothetical protein
MILFNKHTVVISLVALLCGCASPESRKATLNKKAEPCLANTKQLDAALVCLKKQGFKEWREYRNTTLYNSCGMYWGYPLVASCSYIFIEHEGNAIKSYSLKAELDGV